MTDTDELLKHHFEDDRLAFSKIDASFEALRKTDEKFKELLEINGEHMSYIRKDMSEIAQSVKDLAKAQDAHMKEVEPVLKEYQEKLAFWNRAGRYGSKGAKVFLTAGAVIALLAGLKDWLITSIANAIK